MRPGFIVQSLQRLGRKRLAVASMALAAVLVFAVNPEVRLILLWVDFIGVDVLLLFMAFELRHYLAATRPYSLASLPTRLLSLVFPRFSPSLALMGSEPAVALCALLLPVTASAMLLWSAAKAISGRAGGV